MQHFYRTAFVFILSLLIFFSSSCLKSTRPGIPDGVRKTLAESDINSPELMKAVVHYNKPQDSLKQKALYWLITNMRGNYSVHHDIEDSMGNIHTFPPQEYSNYEALEKSWDSVAGRVGTLIYHADSFLLDQRQIQSPFLIKTIDDAFYARQHFSWAKKYDFKMFCQWILPYRCANESLENFRQHMVEKYRPHLTHIDSLTVTEAALQINSLVNKEFAYKDTYNKEANVQTIEQVEKNKYGNFYDLNIYKIKVLRSFGIAAALDYTPYLADTSYGYAWTTVILPDQSELMLEFPQKVKNLYQPGRLAKVYRRTFERDTTGLYTIKNVEETTPPYLGHYFYTDITSDLNTKTVWLPYYKDTHYAYLAVFNDGDWHPVDWTSPKTASGTVFQKMGAHIVYLPVKLFHKKLFRLGNAFYLDQNGLRHEFVPDFAYEQNTALRKTSPYQNIVPGVSYTLYLWNGNWTSLFSFTGKKGGLNAPLPAGGLYLLTNDDPVMQERIFSVSQKGKQIFY